MDSRHNVIIMMYFIIQKQPKQNSEDQKYGNRRVTKVKFDIFHVGSHLANCIVPILKLWQDKA